MSADTISYVALSVSVLSLVVSVVVAILTYNRT